MKYEFEVRGGLVDSVPYGFSGLLCGDIVRLKSGHYDELLVVGHSRDHTCMECPLHYNTGNLCPLYDGQLLCPSYGVFIKASSMMEEL